MEIMFRDASILEPLKTRAKDKSALGNRLNQRLCELAAADSLQDVAHLRALNLTSRDSNGTFSVRLNETARLVIRALALPSSGAVSNLDSVSEIELLAIEPVDEN